MARLIQESKPDPLPTTEHRRVREEVSKRFGWKPGSVEFLKGGSDVDGLCSVTVGAEETVLLVFANGMLVGVPPKKAGS